MTSASVPVSVHINAPPGIVIDPTSLDFGSMDSGATSARSFTIAADSLRSLSGVNAVLAGSVPGDAQIDAFISSNPVSLPANVSAGNALTITVTLTAGSASGDFDFDVDVSTD